ncbi:MAG: hypothetical protein GY841_20275 [FCB group bacterium]|nr:hypothetical protein [FCB group bacterium]
MDRGIARDAMPDNLYSGGILKPRANPPDRTSSRLPRLARLPSPRIRADWFAALAHVRLQSNDPPNAAATMEAPTTQRIRACRVFQRTAHGESSHGLTKSWGKRYAKSRTPSVSAKIA